jgi:hypothetical protein
MPDEVATLSIDFVRSGGDQMADRAWVILLIIALGSLFVYSTWWRWTRGGRATARKIRAQAQMELEARVEDQVEEYARQHGNKGHVVVPSADEIAELHKKYPHAQVRVITAEQAAEMNRRHGWQY